MGNTSYKAISYDKDGFIKGYGIIKDQQLYYTNVDNTPILMKLTYIGFLKNGRKHGRGIMYNDAYSISGVWENGYLKGYAVFITHEFKYEGTMATYLGDDDKGKEVEFLSMEGFGSIMTELRSCTGFFLNNKLLLSCSTKTVSKKIIELSFGLNSKTDVPKSAPKTEYVESFIKAYCTKEENKSIVKVKIEQKNRESIEYTMLESPDALNSCLSKFPLACIFKNINNPCSEENKDENILRQSISNLFQFQSLFSIDESQEAFELKSLCKKSGNAYHFKAQSKVKTKNKDCHIKAKLVFGKNDIDLASWNKMALRRISRMFNFVRGTGFASEHIGVPAYMDAYDNIIYLLRLDTANENINILLSKVGAEAIQSNKYPPYPMLYMEISEWLDPSFFLDALCKSGEYRITQLVPLFIQLIFLFSKLESRGIFYNNIRPQHIWSNNDGQIKIIDFSNAIIANNERAELVDKHTTLVNETPITISERLEMRSSFLNMYSYNFDYDGKIDNSDNLYATIEEKFHNYNNKLLIPKAFSLFRRDAYAFGMTFFTCVMAILRNSNRPEALIELEKQWARLSLLEELSSSVNNEKELKSKQVVYITKFYTNVMRMRDNGEDINGNVDFEKMMKLCISLLCNIELGGDITTTFESFYHMDKQNTRYEIEKFSKKIDALEAKSFASFRQIERYIVDARMGENIAFKEA